MIDDFSYSLSADVVDNVVDFEDQNNGALVEVVLAEEPNAVLDWILRVSGTKASDDTQTFKNWYYQH